MFLYNTYYGYDDFYSTDYDRRQISTHNSDWDDKPLPLKIFGCILLGVVSFYVLYPLIAGFVALVKCCVRRNKRRNSDPEQQTGEATEMQLTAYVAEAARDPDVSLEDLPVPAQPAPAYTTRCWS
jgi:hypothetical protein